MFSYVHVPQTSSIMFGRVFTGDDYSYVIGTCVYKATVEKTGRTLD